MMSSVCSEQQKLSHFLREIEIPPRKLLTSPHRQDFSTTDMFSDETLLRKYLPYNNSGGDSDSNSGEDLYSSDHFRMYEFKVRQCTRSRSHDWTDCPFAHPGEKARRRDPRRHHYSGTVCPDFRRGSCSRGDSCEFAHGVFECWLHPARYRTEACKDGKNCKRKVCFFAHSPRQLRILPSSDATSSPDHLSSPPTKKKFHHHHHHHHHNHHNHPNHQLMTLSPTSNKNHCCVFCSGGGGGNSSVNSSPTSTLLGLSHLSPPMSPMSGGGVIGRGSYKDALTDLMSSLEATHLSSENSANSPVHSPISGCSVCKSKRNFINTSSGLSWLDANSSLSGDQQQFILSPSTPNNHQSLLSENNFFKRPYTSTNSTVTASTANENRAVINAGETSGSTSDPDLGWINDLLM